MMHWWRLGTLAAALLFVAADAQAQFSCIEPRRHRRDRQGVAWVGAVIESARVH